MRRYRRGEVKDYGDAGGLKCVYFNERSIVGKAGEIRTWISTYDYDFWPLQKHGCERDTTGSSMVWVSMFQM